MAALIGTAALPAQIDTPPDLVLYATDAGVINGRWQRVADSSAADGFRLWHPDLGTPKVATPSANPADYFEVEFEAEAGRAYRLWLRAKAQGDQYVNDSVFVQFSGSVTAAGAAHYRIGSTSAATVVVEDCSGCGLSGWGWQDNDYGGLSLGDPIYFATTGPQTLRIQGREDGVSVDQIVLSSSAFFTTPPGTVKNDTTIVPRPAPSSEPQDRMLAFTAAPYFGALDMAAIADLNGDRHFDIAGVFDNAPIEAHTYVNSGTRAFAPGQYEELWGGPEAVRSLDAKDVTGDGRADLVFLDASFNRLVAFAGDGSGQFVLAPRVTPFGERVSDFALADFNHDGFLDIVTTEPERDAAVIHTGRGDGTFAFQSWVSSGPAPGTVATGDFDGDGNVDVATLNAAAESVYFSLSDRTGRLVRQASVATGRDPRALAIADLSGDGLADLVVTYAAAQVSTYVWNGQGSFSPRRDFQASRFGPSTMLDDGLSVADVNGDQRPDILAQSFHNQDGAWFSASVLYGDGTGGVERFDEFTAPGAAPGIPRDLDGDGRVDILLPDANRGFTVLWNDPVDENRPPVARARASAASVPYSQQSALSLDASLSSDPDGHALTYTWTDAGGGHVSSGPAPKPFATARQPGSYSFSLEVNDGHGGRATATITVTISEDRDPSANRPPTVVASASQEGRWRYEWQFQDLPDPMTSLYAEAGDPDGDALTYEWRNAAGQVLGTEAGINPQPALPTGTHAVTVTVRDGRGGEARGTVTVMVLPYEEVYISLSYKELVVGGAWEETEIPASDGNPAVTVVRDRNAGAPKMNAPLAAPASYVDFGFVADPTQEYKLWVRLRAESNSWANDSVWVQFSGAADSAGNAVFREGTSSGLAVNLEECSGCGVSGWGWRDEAWGTPGVMGGTLLRFPAGGVQNVRIQTREDGVSIDQIVLSARTYRSSRPGAVKNDATRLPFTASWGH